MEIPCLAQDAPGLHGGVACNGSAGNRGQKGRKDVKRIEDSYEFYEDLGKGAFGLVKRAKHLETGICYAVKIIDQSRCSSAGMSEIFSEVEIISLMSHRYIIQLKEVFNTGKTLYLVMELLDGGELAARLRKVGHFCESQVKRYCHNILLALEYIHRNGIVHRDLKPANMLLAFESDSSEVKISDFGLAVLIGGDSCLQSCTGTPAFMAPEILMGEPYGQAVDMWALGVIIFNLLTGDYPFRGHTGEEIMRLIENGFVLPDNGVWTSISGPCKDLIRKLLVRDRTKRFTAQDCLTHPWIRIRRDSEFDLLPGSDSECQLDYDDPQRKISKCRKVMNVILCCHRFIYFGRLQMLKRWGCQNTPMASFTALLNRRFASRELDYNTTPVGNKGMTNTTLVVGGVSSPRPRPWCVS